MKTLVIGNGFDLAHGLPTTYTDFLNYLDLAKAIDEQCDGKSILLNTNNLSKTMNEVERAYKGKSIQEPLKNFFEENLRTGGDENKCFSFNVRKLVKKDISSFLENYWYGYFDKISDKNKLKTGTTWIDFEAEITKIVRRLESTKDSTEDINRKIPISLDIFMRQDIPFFAGGSKQRFITRLENDLSLFIKGLDDYIKLIENLDIFLRSPDIDKVPFDNVINFNYSDTYRKFYNPKLDDNKIHFIHGKAGINNSGRSSNLVLGAQETLDSEEESKDLSCIKFKKYYQRIYKQTGVLYKKFMESKEEKELFLFGHSLSDTDGDIIRELIENYDKVRIFYHADVQYREQIVNLVKILGKEKLIQYAEDKVVFVKQKDMVYCM